MLLQKRIHDWSKDLPVWQRDLLRRVTSGPLDDDGVREVFKILAGTADAVSPVPLELKDLPADEQEFGAVELRAVRNLRNINCLAGGQTLALKPGLNVIFGDNGAGKSGYGRLLRRVTRSGEPEEILRDVFDPGAASGPQTAELDLAVEGVQRTITVDLASDPERLLSAMAAFNVSRSRIYLARPNVIEHVPRPLQILRRLADAQDRLADDLRQRADVRRGGLPALPQLGDTAAGRALAALGRGSDPAALVAQARLSDDERRRLEELEATAAAIRADQSRQLEAAARAQVRGAEDAGRALKAAGAQLPASLAAEVAELRRRLNDVTAGEQAMAERAFSDQRFDGTGQGPWREMWFAAERFAQASGIGFPDTSADGACPLCQRDLDAAARERLQRFQEFVSSDLRRQAIDLDDEIQTRLRAIPELGGVRATVEAALRGAPASVTAAADRALAILDARGEATRSPAAGPPPADARTDSLQLTALETYAGEQRCIAERQAALRDEDGQRKVLAELAELRARLALVEAESAISAHVEGLRAIKRIDDAIAQLNTKKISHKLRELQEAAITERLRGALEQELRELAPLVNRIEIVGQASKGETVIHLKLKDPCRAKVGNVLSDGEQRALSIAFFLAEVAVSDGRSAIILDDPVSSLDHERRTYLAERLVAESKRRQVVVFSHDMPFVHLLQEAAGEGGVELHGQTLQRAFHRVGMVADELPIKMLGTGRRLRALRHRLRFELEPLHNRQDPSYEQEADCWLADVRKAYDQLIEDTVFNGVVRRFNAFVRVRKLRGVKWSTDVVGRIEKGMQKTSPKAHHEALELHPGPRTPPQLAVLLDELSSLYDELSGGTKDQPVMPPEVAGQEPIVRAAPAGLRGR